MKNNLKKYQEKRDFTKTAEPKGSKKMRSKRKRFVVQHHMARKDHYDLRLEWKGVLKSFAVPKGPSYNSKEKRLAILVEDHPLEYRNFEGIIPKGQYGGGTVMIWDEGYWEILEDKTDDFSTGKIRFTLKGKKLHGDWVLIHYQDEHWLLKKENDEWAGTKDILDDDRSVRTKRSMEEIALGIRDLVQITNPDKVIIPKPKVTKLDIVHYYEAVAKRMLPYIQGRIISTVRCPKGIEETCFFKKHLETKSKGIGKKMLSNKDGKKEDYYYIKNIDGLIAEVQMNSYEFHTWGSKVTNLNKPDIMVFDLDPDEKVSLKRLRQGVKDLKSILDELQLTAYLKTSGGKGYHVVVSLQTNWRNFREIAKNIAMLMEERWPDRYTSNIRKKERENKIFIDWLRNTKGATSVAPYSLRLRMGASVSFPISWDELDTVKPKDINIKKALERIKQKDPWDVFFD